jgi:hypothetical protein
MRDGAVAVGRKGGGDRRRAERAREGEGLLDWVALEAGARSSSQCVSRYRKASSKGPNTSGAHRCGLGLGLDRPIDPQSLADEL